MTKTALNVTKQVNASNVPSHTLSKTQYVLNAIFPVSNVTTKPPKDAYNVTTNLKN